MTPITYRYFVRGQWAGPADEKPAVTGATFLQTLDSLSAIDPVFSGWQVNRNWKIPEDEEPRLIPLDIARNRIVEIVEKGVVHNDFGKPTPGYGYKALATAGARGPRQASLVARTGDQTFRAFVRKVRRQLRFEHRDLSAVQSGTAGDHRGVECAMVICAGLSKRRRQGSDEHRARRSRLQDRYCYSGPARPDLPQIGFSRSVDYLPFGGARRRREARARNSHGRTPDGGLLMSATEERLDPMNPVHARRARILAETMIACTKKSS